MSEVSEGDSGMRNNGRENVNVVSMRMRAIHLLFNRYTFCNT